MLGRLQHHPALQQHSQTDTAACCPCSSPKAWQDFQCQCNAMQCTAKNKKQKKTKKTMMLCVYKFKSRVYIIIIILVCFLYDDCLKLLLHLMLRRPIPNDCIDIVLASPAA